MFTNPDKIPLKDLPAKDAAVIFEIWRQGRGFEVYAPFRGWITFSENWHLLDRNYVLRERPECDK